VSADCSPKRLFAAHRASPITVLPIASRCARSVLACSRRNTLTISPVLADSRAIRMAQVTVPDNAEGRAVQLVASFVGYDKITPGAALSLVIPGHSTAPTHGVNTICAYIAGETPAGQALAGSTPEHQAQACTRTPTPEQRVVTDTIAALRFTSGSHVATRI
jgi:hypothetical protein